MAVADVKPVFFVKKLGGLLFVAIGMLLLALGFNYRSTELTLIGAVLLLGGAVLLALKIIRRNMPKG